MPRGDKTGPEGRGPATGRGLGGCLPGKSTGKKTTVPSRGFGGGGGLGRGPGGGRGMGGRRKGANGITYYT